MRSEETTRRHQVPLVKLVIDTELDADSASQLDTLLEEALALDPQEVVLDLHRCPFIDAAGIAVLLKAHRRCIHIGCSLTLFSPSPRFLRNLQLASVDRVLRITYMLPSHG